MCASSTFTGISNWDAHAAFEVALLGGLWYIVSRALRALTLTTRSVRRRLERAWARAEAHAEPAGLRCGPSKDRSGGVPYAGPSKDRSGGASYSARERKPTMPATPAQAPPQIGTTPPHPPTYIGEVVPAPVPARASEDGPSLRSAFAASAHFPRAHSASGPLADAGQLPAPGGGQAGAGTQGSRGAWSIGESTGRSSFDSQELSAWRPSQDSGGAQHGADAGRPLVSEAALQVCVTLMRGAGLITVESDSVSLRGGHIWL